MKVNSDRDISFKSLYTSNAVKKTLVFAAENGALFASGAMVAGSFVRPLSIWAAPNTERENRKLASIKSIISSLLSFGLMLCVTTPIANSIKKIDRNPQKYLTKESIDLYKKECEKLEESKSYAFATQMFKLGIGTIATIPKSIITAASIPYVLDLFKNKKEENSINCQKEINFKGKKTNGLTGIISKILNKKDFKNFSDKYKNTNFPMHIAAITDTLATGAFIWQNNKNNSIDKKHRTVLNYNSAISTFFSIASSYIVDKFLDKPTQKFIQKYKKVNANDKNLEKQVQGIKIIKPMLIMGTIYYCLIPFISTIIAEKTSKNKSN